MKKILVSIVVAAVMTLGVLSTANAAAWSSYLKVNRIYTNSSYSLVYTTPEYSSYGKSYTYRFTIKDPVLVGQISDAAVNNRTVQFLCAGTIDTTGTYRYCRDATTNAILETTTGATFLGR